VQSARDELMVPGAQVLLTSEQHPMGLLHEFWLRSSKWRVAGSNLCHSNLCHVHYSSDLCACMTPQDPNGSLRASADTERRIDGEVLSVLKDAYSRVTALLVRSARLRMKSPAGSAIASHLLLFFGIDRITILAVTNLQHCCSWMSTLLGSLVAADRTAQHLVRRCAHVAGFRRAATSSRGT